jgi:hypothetical protein
LCALGEDRFRVFGVLSIASGYSPEYLLKEVATGRENYYTRAVAEGEPPGRWWGAGAEKLGLTGLVDAQDMRAVYERFLDPRAEGFGDRQRWAEVSTLGHAGRMYLTEDELYAAALEREPNATAERRAELRVEAGKAARHNVAFYDVTFSVQKSVTLVHTAFEAQEVAARGSGDEQAAAAWAEFRKAVEDAIWAGNNAGLAYLAERAGYARVGHHGGAAGRWVDAHDWVVASFFQHDSRDHDPQLHIHNPILNRVEGPDGQWLALDGRSLYRWRPAAAAVAERVAEERLTHALGLLVATRPDGKAREVLGVAQEAMDLISSRRRKVTAKAAELIEAFEHKHGRAPNGLERDRLARQATFATRAAKSHWGLTREQLLDRVDAQVRAEISGGLAGIARAALAARERGGPAPMRWSPQAVVEVALEEVQRSKAGWTEADLARAINAALPDCLGLPDGRDVAELLDQLTRKALACAHALDAARPGDEHLPADMRLRNGESAYQAPGARLYATPGQVRTERELVAATAASGAAVMPREAAQRFLDRLRKEGLELGVDQAAAVRGVLTSGARVESLVGPAGTGKSFVVGMVARAWGDPQLSGGPQRRVFGLASSQIAADVLAAEGLTARNVTRWLDTQSRLEASPGERGPVGDDEAWRLRAGDLVVVDESAMTDTSALAAVHRHVDQAGAKLLLVGDHRQLAAVGAGGGMDLLARAGARYELAEARRFAADWEREASLRLRAGDSDVLREYHRHGRLLDSGTREQAEASAARAWLADTLTGRSSLLLVDTNEQAAHVSAKLRAELVRLGRVDEHGVPLGMQGTYAGVGDLVQARANAWHLAGFDGNRRGPINRENYRVTAIRDDGSLEVTTTVGDGPGEPMVLPADYVAQHLTLAYASTVYAAQGQTVDTSHAVVTAATSPAALYVSLSRGRGANTAHVATQALVDDPARGSDAHSLHRQPVAVLAATLDRSDTAVTRSALAVAAESAQEAGTVRTAAELLADAAQLAATERTATWLDQLTGEGVLTPRQRIRIAAEDGAASLTRVLRRAELAGHDPRAELHQAIIERPFDGTRNLTNVIHSRITAGNTRRFDPVGDTWTDLIPQVEHPEWRDYLVALATAADERAADLAADLVKAPPSWALNALGPVPDHLTERQGWQQRAAVVTGYRELRRHDDEADALGPAPKPGQVEAYAAYRAAWRALGRPEIDRTEHEMTDGALRSRIRAWEREQTWAPRYVGNELAGTRQTSDTHRQTAALRDAEAAAAAATDETERARLETEAHEAAALADVLDKRAAQLQQLDDARAEYLAHTAATRANADVARYLLAERHADAEPERQVTAEEWLAAERADRAADDSYRPITEHDLVDNTDRGLDPQRRADHVADTAAEPDLREIAAREPLPVREDDIRVPTADDVAAALARANRSITEIRARAALDEQADAAERAEQLTRWHTDDVQLDEARDEDDLVYHREVE